MSMDDVVKALQAFAGAYGKAADTLLSGSSHESIGGATAKWVFDKIKEAIQAKKHCSQMESSKPVKPRRPDHWAASLVALLA